MVEILIRREGLLTKIRQALDVWAKERPWEVRDAARLMQQMRDRRHNSMGKDEEGDVCMGKIPGFVYDILGMSEFETNMLYGSPCGTGNKGWFDADGVPDLFFSEFQIGKMTTMNGAPKRRSERG